MFMNVCQLKKKKNPITPKHTIPKRYKTKFLEKHAKMMIEIFFTFLITHFSITQILRLIYYLFERQQEGGTDKKQSES